ncbi:hypothetical protein WR25_18283 [Diploscapter pachys]|uniref:Uncharacterized protein n=1 Tax=Diploscapter pachys TaxID=2018661 RepID=A0A2A2LED7_9BILA|nr:hypothetical protein WR25_18283 [Diploscapter pachys]
MCIVLRAAFLQCCELKTQAEDAKGEEEDTLSRRCQRAKKGKEKERMKGRGQKGSGTDGPTHFPRTEDERDGPTYNESTSLFQ